MSITFLSADGRSLAPANANGPSTASNPPPEQAPSETDRLVQSARTGSPTEAGAAKRALDIITGNPLSTESLIQGDAPPNRGVGEVSLKREVKRDAKTFSERTEVSVKLGGISEPGGDAAGKAKTRTLSADVTLSGVQARSVTQNDDGTLTYKMEADVKVAANAKIDVKVASAGGGMSAGARMTYNVTAPKGTDPTTINPHNAADWPVGTRVQTSDESYRGTALELGYRLISIGGENERRSGHSLVMEKSGVDAVGVVVGPTEGFTASGKVKFDTGVGVSFELGAERTFDDAHMKSFHVDLGTRDGRAALTAAAAGGRLPTDNGGGISRLVDIHTMDLSNKSSASINLPTGAIGIDGASARRYVDRTYPDGRIEHEMTFDAGKDGDQELKITNVSRDGGRTWGEATFKLWYDVRPDNVDLARQLTGNPTIIAGDKIGVTLTPDQIDDMCARSAFGDPRALSTEQREATQTQFAYVLADNGDLGTLFNDYHAPSPDGTIAPRDVDPDRPLPFELQVIAGSTGIPGAHGPARPTA